MPLLIAGEQGVRLKKMEDDMEKVVYVKAHFCPIGKEVVVKVETGKTKKGFFGGEKKIKRKEKKWEQTGWSETDVDGERLAQDVERTIENLNEQGYYVKTITPIISGSYNYNFKSQGISSSKRTFSETESVSGGASYGYGYGYSYTDSLIITARKNS